MIPHPVLITPKESMLVVVALWNIIRWITLEVEFRFSGQSWPFGKGEVIRIGKNSGFFLQKPNAKDPQRSSLFIMRILLLSTNSLFLSKVDHLHKQELSSLEIRLWVIFCSDGGRKKNQYPEFYQELLPLFGEKYGMI